MPSVASKLLATTSIAVSIPLLLSHQIRDVSLPHGIVFALIYTWGMVSVVLAAPLFIMEIVAVSKRTKHLSASVNDLAWHVPALSCLSIGIYIYWRAVLSQPPG